MNLFDLHCDTALTLYKQQLSLGSNECHIDLDRAAKYPHYAQVMAIWSAKRLDDRAAYRQYHHAADYFLRQADAERGRAMICRTAEDLHAAWDSNRTALFWAVEDARILEGEIDRLPVLFARGVRFLTLAWGSSSCICGAHNTGDGLTDFGREVVRCCFELGIAPDISHGSDAAMDETIAMAQAAGKPVIATHSNSRSVCAHNRNLTDAQFCAIRDLGGIVGISLCPEHLRADGPASVEDIVRHIEHYLSLGGENTVALGADLDGTSLPEGFSGIEDISSIADALAAHGHSEACIDAIFSGNALRFVEKNLHK